MRKYAYAMLVAVFAVGGLADGVAAQVRPVTFGISGGPSLARGHIAEEAGTGYHVQGSVGIAPGALPVGLRADLIWQELPDEHSGHFRQVGGLLNALIGVPLPAARPYLLLGGGFLSTSEPEEDHGDHAHGGGSETGLGFNAGVGIEFPFLGLGGVIEARVLNLLGDTDRQTIPISFGIRF